MHIFVLVFKCVKSLAFLLPFYSFKIKKNATLIVEKGVIIKIVVSCRQAKKKSDTTVCGTCQILKNEISQLKGKVTRLKNKIASNQEQWVQTFKKIQVQKQVLTENIGKTIVVTNTIMRTCTINLKALKLHQN